MLPLYTARLEDLSQGDFVEVDCAACQHVALLTNAGGPAEGRAPFRDEGSGPQRPAPVPRVREEGAGGGLGEVGAAKGMTRTA